MGLWACIRADSCGGLHVGRGQLVAIRATATSSWQYHRPIRVTCFYTPDLYSAADYEACADSTIDSYGHADSRDYANIRRAWSAEGRGLRCLP